MAKMRVRAKLIDNVRSIGDNGRRHAIIFDLPVEAGGTDMGATPLEVALMALAECALTIYADIARRSRIELTNLEAVAEAEKPKGSSTLANVKVKARVISKARKYLLDAVWRKTEMGCLVLNVFREPISVDAKFEIESATE